MKKNVLLVEDDPALRMVMREVLKDEFEILETDNGADAIRMGVSRENDLIILDYQLPKKNGIEVIEAIRAAHPNVPVIVLSGFLNKESEAEFERFGASEIFPKPFNYRALLESVRALALGRAGKASKTRPKPSPGFAIPALEPTEAEMLKDSLNALASLAEKVEFLQSVAEKYWIEPSDVATIRETARCMEGELQKFYGKMNGSVFHAGPFSSPVIASATRPCLSGNN